MGKFSFNDNNINNLLEISMNAGKAIMEIYDTAFDIEFKDDQSPLTEADILSHEIILRSLKKLTPAIPVLSEESSRIPLSERKSWEKYWLVDPLDGTKEFINRNGEFTTNIAFIENKRPIFGVIHAPCIGDTYWGGEGLGSFMMNDNNELNEISVSIRDRKPLKVLTSRSHKSKKEFNFLDGIEHYQEISIGSSLKFCYLASGLADIYPRFGPTSEWDIAAGEAILTFSGGNLLGDKRSKILYNSSENYLNQSFFAYSGDSFYAKYSDHFYDLAI